MREIVGRADARRALARPEAGVGDHALPLLQASGGIRGIDDIRALADIGVSAAIIGMALYTGTLDPQTIIEEFAA